MDAPERPKLGGYYAAPPVKIGYVLTDEIRKCDVAVVGWSGRRITWPIGVPLNGEGEATIIVNEGLAHALRVEAPEAVAHWWGIPLATVEKWRAALAPKSLKSKPRARSKK